MGQANTTLRNLESCFGQSNYRDESITGASLEQIAGLVADCGVTDGRLVST